MGQSVSERLLAWYRQNARDLPWRRSPAPYAVLVSELMLQQTRVDTVIPYFNRWMERFPTVSALAEAPEQAVLKAWEGLGYYSRARALQRAAKQILAEHGGEIPASRVELERLPGVGPYTAGAIASIAFGQDEAALDGNIRRVLARLVDLALPARSPEGEKALWALARSLLPAGQAGDFNQALMDLGASLCTPRKPACPVCPLAEDCLARQNGTQAERPVRSERQRTPHYIVTAAVIERDDRVMIAQRPADGLLGGMWEFPGGKVRKGESLEACLQREIQEELGAQVKVGTSLGMYKHAFTHFKITLHAFRCRLVEGSEPRPVKASAIRWLRLDELDDYPMGKVDRLISQRLRH
ncbi:MAG TPA: A/G-specific adenine glycosylase [Anaerolineaceae bacterium]